MMKVIILIYINLEYVISVQQRKYKTNTCYVIYCKDGKKYKTSNEPYYVSEDELFN